MIDYRDARPEDGEAIGRMAAESFVDTFGHLYAPADLATFLGQLTKGLPQEICDPRYRVHVALDGEAIAGFAKFAHASALPAPSSPADCELKQLYVLPAYKGTPVARTLMDWTMEQARAGGATRIVLSVFAENVRAQRFYARYGFAEIGFAPFAVGEQIDDDRIWSCDL